MNITTGRIAALLGGELIGDENALITHPGKIEQAGKGAITFLANPKYLHHLKDTEATAILIDKKLQLEDETNATLIRVDNVYLALSKLLESMNIGPQYPEGISDTAIIAENVVLGNEVAIGEGTVIEKDVVIGEGTRIFAQAYIGKGVHLGKNCTIFPGVKIHHNSELGDNCVIQSNAVIGSDGFGYAPDSEGRYHKIPQIGNVVLEDNVEIGACTVVDRATMGSTLIATGTKLDNLIQIAHNVRIGSDTVIAAQAGVAGSATLGNKAVIGGQVGIAGHIYVADKTMIQAQSGIASSIEKEGAKKYGSPALDYGNYLRSYAVFKELPDLLKEIRTLRNEIEKLKRGEGKD